MLSEGYVYFNSISKYRNDTSNYRGDENEGKIPIDPICIQILDKNGQNIFEKIPRPDSVKLSHVDDDGILIFCTAMITEEILYNEGSHYVFNNEFKAAIKDFGEHVLLFNSGEFLSKLSKAQLYANPKFGYISGPIIYRDLNDYSNPNINVYNLTKSVFDPLFVKSEQYKMQNEWRLIVDGSDNYLPTNADGSYIIKIEKLEWANIFDIETFLEIFQYTP
ncbi:hypothetical protein J2TS4_51260 [Paenibacillus sp. J2TS4]|nr:hypothetical protein J2TS4_51260 [Paenibacillus sp. J2TS4]